MLKNYLRLILFLSFSLNTSFGSSNWLPYFLECRCFGNDEVQCLKDVEKQFGLGSDLILNRTPTHLQRALSDKMLSKMNTDRTILKTQYEHFRRQENLIKSSCLVNKLNSLENVIQQSLFQRSHLSSNALSYTLLGELSKLANQLYSDAYYQCIGNKPVLNEELSAAVPALNSCGQQR